MLDKDIFLEGMAIVSEITGKRMSEPAQRIYYKALQSMTDEQFKKATEHIICSRKFTSLPTPAEWLEQFTTDNDAQVIQAWQKIEYAMARVGAYQTVMFDDRLIHGFIQTFEGGWPGLCATPIDDMKWIRKDFERYYRAMSNRASEIICKPLIGLSEGSNIKHGQKDRGEIAYIGDKQKAKALLTGPAGQTNKLIEGIAKDMEG